MSVNVNRKGKKKAIQPIRVTLLTKFRPDWKPPAPSYYPRLLSPVPPWLPGLLTFLPSPPLQDPHRWRCWPRPQLPICPTIFWCGLWKKRSFFDTAFSNVSCTLKNDSKYIQELNFHTVDNFIPYTEYIPSTTINLFKQQFQKVLQRKRMAGR